MTETRPQQAFTRSRARQPIKPGRTSWAGLRVIDFEGRTFFVDFPKREFRDTDTLQQVIPFDSPLGARMCDEPLLTSCPMCYMGALIPVYLANDSVLCFRCEDMYRVDFSRRWP